METVLILVQQILQMFILAGLGFLLFKGKKISLESSKALGNILIYLALPSVIIKGFLVERDAAHMLGILYSGLGAAVLLLLSILISRWLFGKDAIAAFASSFANPGFFGIPLIIASAAEKEGAVFYVACFVAFLNIGQWTYGVSILNGQPIRQGLSLKKLIRAPFIIAILIGLTLFFTQPALPKMITDCLSTVAALNTPLAMFTVGVYLAQVDVLAMFRRKALYAVAFSRLLLIPMISLLLLTLLPKDLLSMKTALLIASACPVGVNVAVYAQLHGKDYAYAVETVVISTLLSVVTIPAVVWLSSVLW
ncbi:MAG: AEC family transporter [Clostridia bacterium]|nr:AEC family transporter [Clostridia bacterium]